MIYLGYILLSGVLGFFIGASNTPVVASFFAITVGLLGTFFGVTKLDSTLSVKYKLHLTGLLLALFSSFLLLGALAGEFYRTNDVENKSLFLPWEGKPLPSNTYEAIDWMVLSRKLSKLGYSEENISMLYEIRILELEEIRKRIEQEDAAMLNEFERTRIYEETHPFHSTIPEIGDISKKVSRGLASE